MKQDQEAREREAQRQLKLRQEREAREKEEARKLKLSLNDSLKLKSDKLQEEKLDHGNTKLKPKTKAG